MFRYDRRHFIKSGLATAAATAVPLAAEGAEFYPSAQKGTVAGFTA